MTIYDKQNTFSDDQSLAGIDDEAIISENVLKVGPGDFGQGNDLLIDVIVTEDFDVITSLAVSLITDDDVAFGSATVLYTTPAILLADLVKGYKFAIKGIPAKCEDYIALNYTAVGGPSTVGSITASITPVTSDTDPSF